VLAGGYTLPVDVARVNGRIFLNNSSIGLYAHMVEIRVTELAPIAKVEADRAAQQHRLHRQDYLQPLHDLRPGLPEERTSVGQHNCEGK
jgi:diacylglycerol kinase family enzyme